MDLRKSVCTLAGDKPSAKVKVVQLEEVRDFMSEDEDSPSPSMLQHRVSLNPHKALQMLSSQATRIPETDSTILSSEAMKNIRGAIGRKAPGSQTNKKISRLSPAELPLQAPPPPQLIRERTASRSGDRDVIARKCRISNSFIELEQLLDIMNKKSRAEVLEFAVTQIKSLQKSINEAGERNGDLHDMVESISIAKNTSGKPPPGQPLSNESFVTTLISKCNKNDIREARQELSRMRPFTGVDTILMSCVGLAANIAPVEYRNPVVGVTVHGLCRWVVRMLSLVLIAVVFIKYLHRVKHFTFRKVLVSLLSLSSGNTEPQYSSRLQHLTGQRLAPSARSRSSSSSSLPRYGFYVFF